VKRRLRRLTAVGQSRPSLRRIAAAPGACVGGGSRFEAFASLPRSPPVRGTFSRRTILPASISSLKNAADAFVFGRLPAQPSRGPRQGARRGLRGAGAIQQGRAPDAARETSPGGDWALRPCRDTLAPRQGPERSTLCALERVEDDRHAGRGRAARRAGAKALARRRPPRQVQTAESEPAAADAPSSSGAADGAADIYLGFSKGDYAPRRARRAAARFALPGRRPLLRALAARSARETRSDAARPAPPRTRRAGRKGRVVKDDPRKYPGKEDLGLFQGAVGAALAAAPPRRAALARRRRRRPRCPERRHRRSSRGAPV
jgi:hypothetical protein